MLIYPGGTPLDATTTGYSLSRNFLSDLGRTVAYNGRPNQLGAFLFTLSLGVLVVGFALLLVRLPRLISKAGRGWARAAVVVGVLVSVAFAGVAVTPENRFWLAHVFLSCWGFRLFPLVPAFLAVATLKDRQFTRLAGLMWVLVAGVLCGYAVIREMGPQPDTLQGLELQVVAQKLVALALALFLVYQSYRAERIPSGSAPQALATVRRG